MKYTISEVPLVGQQSSKKAALLKLDVNVGVVVLVGVVVGVAVVVTDGVKLGNILAHGLLSDIHSCTDE